MDLKLVLLPSVALFATAAQAFSRELETHHIEHFSKFESQANGFNRFVLRGIDIVQSRAFTGGSYFIGVKAVPAESPICYPLILGGKPLLDPPREASYCSGASYAAFIEATDLYLRTAPRNVTDAQIEALRMQEPNGGRREDEVKAWGWWNADGFGNQFCLVQLMKAGVRVAPKDATPGDFMNISWKKGAGHSTVFLGWETNESGVKGVRFWSSQKGTDGFGDMWAPFENISEVCIVRCTKPEAIFDFDAKGKVSRDVKGDKLSP